MVLTPFAQCYRLYGVSKNHIRGSVGIQDSFSTRLENIFRKIRLIAWGRDGASCLSYIHAQVGEIVPQTNQLIKAPKNT